VILFFYREYYNIYVFLNYFNLIVKNRYYKWLFIFSLNNFTCSWLINPDFHSRTTPSEHAAPPNRLPSRTQTHGPYPPAESITLFHFILNLNVSSYAKIFPKKELTYSTKSHVTLVYSSMKLICIGCVCSELTNKSENCPCIIGWTRTAQATNISIYKKRKKKREALEDRRKFCFCTLMCIQSTRFSLSYNTALQWKGR